MAKNKNPYIMSFVLNLILGLYFCLKIFIFFLALGTQTGYTFSTYNSYIIEIKELYYSLYLFLFFYLTITAIMNIFLLKLHKNKGRVYNNKKYFFVSFFSFFAPCIYSLYQFLS